MVLDAFSIDARGVRINADINQICFHNRVPLTAFAGKFVPGFAQENTAIRLALNEASFNQPGQCARDRRLRDAQTRGNIHLPRLACTVNQIVDQLHIVFKNFITPRNARLLKGSRLISGVWKRCTPF